VVKKLSFLTEKEAVADTKGRAMWIVSPLDPFGGIERKMFPKQGSNRCVFIQETSPCPICSGEDHRLVDCRWISEQRVDTWWGGNSFSGPSKKKKTITTSEETAPVPDPEAQTTAEEDATPPVGVPAEGTAANDEEEDADSGMEESEDDAA
jgi:hypothetical protein